MNESKGGHAIFSSAMEEVHGVPMSGNQYSHSILSPVSRSVLEIEYDVEGIDSLAERGSGVPVSLLLSQQSCLLLVTSDALCKQGITILCTMVFASLGPSFHANNDTKRTVADYSARSVAERVMRS